VSEKGQGTEGQLPVGTGTVLAGPEGGPPGGGAATAPPPPHGTDGRTYTSGDPDYLEWKKTHGSEATDPGGSQPAGGGGGATQTADQTAPGFHYDEKTGMYWSGDPNDPNSIPFEIRGDKPRAQTTTPAPAAEQPAPPEPKASAPSGDTEGGAEAEQAKFMNDLIDPNVPPPPESAAAAPGSATPAVPPPPLPLDEDDAGGFEGPSHEGPWGGGPRGAGGGTGPHGPDEGTTQIDPPNIELQTGPGEGGDSVLAWEKDQNKPVID
jgi:hypothetical protein